MKLQIVFFITADWENYLQLKRLHSIDSFARRNIFQTNRFKQLHMWMLRSQIIEENLWEKRVEQILNLLRTPS